MIEGEVEKKKPKISKKKGPSSKTNEQSKKLVHDAKSTLPKSDLKPSSLIQPKELEAIRENK